jgi:hypothetical protein
MEGEIMKTQIVDVPGTYGGLADILQPRPIHNEREYRKAVRMIDRIAGHELNRDQEDYQEALAVFVASYEDERHPMKLKPIPPHEALKLVIEESGMNASGLGRLLVPAPWEAPFCAGNGE